jgi:two-component sensor histidine kinase/ligand-binding sensor protein
LDPESWGDVLEAYAQTVDLGVVLVDRDGRLIGRCHNPKPIWTLARAARTEWGAGCIFCLNSDASCTAAADAQRTGALTEATDAGGFAHVAVPLSLDGRHLGTLLAGQAFDQYPELPKLERVAGQFGLSPQTLWDLARRCVPISRSNLIRYGTLLGFLGRAFLGERQNIMLQRDLSHINQLLQDANSALNQKLVELAQSNIQKDVLLNEVHHRVNNNLQVISSLLRMQAGELPDDPVAVALRASQLRIESMALIHSQLCGSSGERVIDFAGYTATLGNNLLRSYGMEDRIVLRLGIDHFALSLDQAIPAGLILNELISNALKHAFPDSRTGSVSIQGCLRHGRVELSVKDDGAGIQVSTAPRKRSSLGLNIVNILCHQLKGTFGAPQNAEAPDTGALFRVSFPFAQPPASHPVTSDKWPEPD